MLDKERLLSHLHSEDDQLLGSHILDKIEMVLNRHKEQATDFLNPYQREIARGLLEQISDINFREEGGYRQAERKRIVIFPEYLFPDLVPAQIDVLKISGNFSFQSISHRDFLGAILGLGIQRKVIGDLLVLDGYAQVIAAKEISEFIELKLMKVHEVPVEIEAIEAEQLEIPVQHTKEIKTTVPSMRLDAVASSGFGDSRSKMTRYIKGGRVKLNYKEEKDPAADVELGDLISVRGRGRVEVAVDNGFSNRGRIKLILKRYT